MLYIKKRIQLICLAAAIAVIRFAVSEDSISRPCEINTSWWTGWFPELGLLDCIEAENGEERDELTYKEYRRLLEQGEQIDIRYRFF